MSNESKAGNDIVGLHIIVLVHILIVSSQSKAGPNIVGHNIVLIHPVQAERNKLWAFPINWKL